MTTITDPIGPLVTLLLADGDVAALAGTRVFGGELPPGESASQPRKAVVLRFAGGAVPTYTAATVPLHAIRFDAYCYGENPFEADNLRRAVHGALKRMKRQVISNVLVHWVRPAGGAADLRDAEAGWPIAWSSWQVLADERAA